MMKLRLAAEDKTAVDREFDEKEDARNEDDGKPGLHGQRTNHQPEASEFTQPGRNLNEDESPELAGPTVAA